MCLPLDCANWQAIEWSDAPVAVATPKPKRNFKDVEKSVVTVALPAPVQFKSLAESLNDLVAAVRRYQRPANPLTAAFR
jgi:hypothetical protein